MNSTVPSDNGLDLYNNNINGFKFFIGISVGVILLITTIVISSFYCTRIQNPPRRNIHNHEEEEDHNHNIDVHEHEEEGLDEVTLQSYPRLLFSEAKLQNKHSTSLCCSICLGDYISTDIVRLLPDCGHLFHLKCVDPWLRNHPTCPVCRSSPLPTPQSTPLADTAIVSMIRMV